MALENDTKHDRVCKSVTEINDHAKNFPNAPRSMGIMRQSECRIMDPISFIAMLSSLIARWFVRPRNQ